MFNRVNRFTAIFFVFSFVCVDNAAAHHVMGGKTPTTFAQGFLSGLGHPVIGIDHLAFIVAVGLVAGIAGLTLFAPAVFIVASAIGVALHVQGVSLPGVELTVATSVLIVGALIAANARITATIWLLLFTVAGLFHGYAYGESIFGAEATPLWAYLAGLTLIQGTITTAVAIAVRRRTELATLAPRLAGAVVAGIGLATLAGHILPG